MAKRLKLQKKFEEMLKSKNVYYQPPGNNCMGYPAIRYSKKKPLSKHANDGIYLDKNCYEVIVIDRLPDNPVIEDIRKLPYCSYDRHYVADNLNHDVLTLYY